ncbi:MAG: spore germination protein GerW family protein [Pseudomonadota bacterium]
MLHSKTVVGEPITVGDNTLIPWLSVGFGFGVGSGRGDEPTKGSGGGTGGGVKPVALVVVNDKGVQVEPVKASAATIMEKVVETVGKATAKTPAQTTAAPVSEPG